MQSFSGASFRPLQMGSFSDIFNKYKDTFLTPGTTSQPVAAPLKPAVVVAPATTLGVANSTWLWGGAAVLGAGLVYAVATNL